MKGQSPLSPLYIFTTLCCLAAASCIEIDDLSAAQPNTRLNTHFISLFDEYLHSPEETQAPQQIFRRQLLIDHILSPKLPQDIYELWINFIDDQLLKDPDTALAAYNLVLGMQARWEALYLETYHLCHSQNLALLRGSQGGTAGTALTLASFLIPQIDRRVPLYLKLFRHSFPLLGAYAGWELGDHQHSRLRESRVECLPSSIPPAPAHLSQLSAGVDFQDQDWLDEMSYDQLIYGAMSLSISFSTYELLRKLQLSLKGISLVSRSALLAGLAVSAGALAAEKGVEKTIETQARRKLEADLQKALQQEQALAAPAKALGQLHALDFYQQLIFWQGRREALKQELCQARQNQAPEISSVRLKNRLKLLEEELSRRVMSSLGAESLNRDLTQPPSTRLQGRRGCQWSYEAYQVLAELAPMGLSSRQSQQLSLSWPRQRAEVLNHLRYQASSSKDEIQWIKQKMYRLQTELSDRLLAGQICSDSALAFLFQVESLLIDQLRQLADQDQEISPNDSTTHLTSEPFPQVAQRNTLELSLLEIRIFRRSLEDLAQGFLATPQAPSNTTLQNHDNSLICSAS